MNVSSMGACILNWPATSRTRLFETCCGLHTNALNHIHILHIMYKIIFIYTKKHISTKRVRIKTTVESRGYRVAVLMGCGKLTPPEGLAVYVCHTHLEVGEGRSPEICA